MRSDRVEAHEGTSGFAYIRDAWIVAFRWDLLESGLVLDVDAPTSEYHEAQYMRAWVIFDSVSDLSMPAMNEVRVSKGLWSGTELRRDSVGDGEHRFISAFYCPDSPATSSAKARSARSPSSPHGRSCSQVGEAAAATLA